jgi:hypothetical protein
MANLSPSNPVPSNPRPDNPKFGATWFDDASDEFLAWDGEEWVPYPDLPPWPRGRDLSPKAIDRDD